MGGDHRIPNAVGADDGLLAYELALASDLKIVLGDADPRRLQQIRTRLGSTGLLGWRISLQCVDTDKLRYGPFLANLIVSERSLSSPSVDYAADALQYCLRPAGGTLVLGTPQRSSEFERWREDSGLDWDAWDSELANLWIHRRGKVQFTFRHLAVVQSDLNNFSRLNGGQR